MARRKHKKAGLSPGSVIFTGDRKVEKVHIHYIEYNEKELKEIQVDNQKLSNLYHPDGTRIQWYDFRGLHDTELIEEVGRLFNVHPLILEDVVDTQQRAKFEEYTGGNFVTLRSLAFNSRTRKVSTEQVALYFGEGFLLSFQEDVTDLFVDLADEHCVRHGDVVSAR